jgi:hypothetical protein
MACEDSPTAPPTVTEPLRAGGSRERPTANDDMPPCRMFLDAESLNQITGTSILGWRAGSVLLGCIASMDMGRRVLLVTSAEDSYLIADLVVNHRPGGDERPQVGRDRQRCQAGRR